MATKQYFIEMPEWFNDTRTVEQLLVRLLLACLAAKETGVM